MNKLYLATFMLACAALGSGGVFAARISDVRGTMHNLSSTAPTSTVKAVSQTGICIFCHTAHGSPVLTPPLWNKTLSVAAYETYTSSSLDALSVLGITELPQPDDNSKLCLSCHDGTVAIGAVDRGGPITMSGTDPPGPTGVMPAGSSGATSGYTRRLGTDLRNDHPISVNYTQSLALRDGELRVVDSGQKWPGSGATIIGPRDDLGSHKLPLFGSVTLAQVQCPTCHDPHLRDNDPAVGNQKFLRLNRFQEDQPTATFSEANDIICLACHDKGQGGNSWAYSAHAHKLVANETYLAGPGALREFPTDLPVWKASCLNCHDTHTVQGARRLLREGTDGLFAPLTGKAGGAPASEETCFQCHDTLGAAMAISNLALSVPNIKPDYGLGISMPLAAQPEVHDIGALLNGLSFNDSAAGGVDCTTATNKCGADFIESRLKLGAGNLANRHAECSDCHNPHRVVKFRDFRGKLQNGDLTLAPDAAGTHSHGEPGIRHSNIASGVLRGMTGVEPVYSSASFQTMPTGFNFKRGDPGTNAVVDPVNAVSHVTREYQVCLKCHSNYGYTDNNLHYDSDTLALLGNRPRLTNSAGGTLDRTNLLEMFTNQAKEFQAPASHRGKPAPDPGNSGASAAYSTNNHRSWHPVMGDAGIEGTGRTPLIRGGGVTPADPNIFLPPWNGVTGGISDIGAQTMYCSDCHGSDTGAASGGSNTTVVPVGGEDGKPWGPHGSSNNFLLKGKWDQDSGSGGATDDALCFRCHDYNQYANPSSLVVKKRSGFSGLVGAVAPDNDINMHLQHAFRMDSTPTKMRCTQCHEAVSHGWKNKALLVNLNDVGAEAGNPSLASITIPYNMQPYYLGARLRINATGFAKSGEWKKADCAGCHL